MKTSERSEDETGCSPTLRAAAVGGKETVTFLLLTSLSDTVKRVGRS